jgi:hypothetical protein
MVLAAALAKSRGRSKGKTVKKAKPVNTSRLLMNLIRIDNVEQIKLDDIYSE